MLGLGHVDPGIATGLPPLGYGFGHAVPGQAPLFSTLQQQQQQQQQQASTSATLAPLFQQAADKGGAQESLTATHLIQRAAAVAPPSSSTAPPSSSTDAEGQIVFYRWMETSVHHKQTTTQLARLESVQTAIQN